MTTWQSPLQNGDAAPDSELKDTEGNPVTLSSLWQAGDTIITFIRHFGCPACRAMLKELELNKPQLEQAGLRVVAIGMGTPARTKAFIEEMGVSFPIFSDPRRQSYEAYRLMKMDWREQLRPSEFLKTTQNILKHGGDATTDQDVMQLGGTFIVNRHGTITFAYTNKAMSDDPNVAMLLQAATA